MKTNPATILLGVGIAALVVGVFVAEKTSVASPSGTPPQKIDPTIGAYTLADGDALAASNQTAGQALVALGVPAHAFVTSKNLGALLPDTQGVNVGTVSAWIAKQRAAGHRVFMSPPITSPSMPGEVVYAFVLDTQPAGYTEVTS